MDVYRITQLHMVRERCLGLIEKSGENPARSRHCNGEHCYILMPLGKPGKAGQGDEPESGDLPVPTHAVTTYER